MRQHPDAYLPARGLGDQPLCEAAGIELKPTIIDQGTGNLNPAVLVLFDS